LVLQWRRQHRRLRAAGMVHTQYHFKVHHTAFEGALDRLAQFFTAPLVAADAVSREVEAVHAEFSRK
jgi:insulysin